MPARERDPLGPSLLIAALFALLAGWRLGIPSALYFDEVHYVPAARKLLALRPANIEHPMLAKEAIAAAIALLGDRPVAWRIPSLLAGTLGLFAFGRALWWASHRRFATLAGMVLLASDFAWFVQSRIAMLDMVMAGLGMVAFWQVAAALRTGARGNARAARLRLATAGLCMGLAVGAKWSVVPAFAVMGLVLVAARIAALRAPVRVLPGLPLAEIVFWLCSLPLAIYWLTFLPAAFWRETPLDLTRIVPWHRQMIALQDSVIAFHPYRTVWYQWVGDWRGIWYLYEKVDGAQRGVLLIGNPLTMLAGLPALAWCLWAAIRHRRWDAAAPPALYAASLAMWILSGKPVQFYYHYLLAGSFLVAALALALDALWHSGARWRWAAPALVLGSCGIFAWFWPILSGAPLHDGIASFEHWMWLKSWR